MKGSSSTRMVPTPETTEWCQNPKLQKNVQEDLEPFLAKVKDKTLKETLKAGVGLMHDALNDSDRSIVETLVASAAIQVPFHQNPAWQTLTCFLVWDSRSGFSFRGVSFGFLVLGFLVSGFGHHSINPETRNLEPETRNDSDRSIVETLMASAAIQVPNWYNNV